MMAAMIYSQQCLTRLAKSLVVLFVARIVCGVCALKMLVRLGSLPCRLLTTFQHINAVAIWKANHSEAKMIPDPAFLGWEFVHCREISLPRIGQVLVEAVVLSGRVFLPDPHRRVTELVFTPSSFLPCCVSDGCHLLRKIYYRPRKP